MAPVLLEGGAEAGRQLVDEVRLLVVVDGHTDGRVLGDARPAVGHLGQPPDRGDGGGGWPTPQWLLRIARINDSCPAAPAFAKVACARNGKSGRVDNTTIWEA